MPAEHSRCREVAAALPGVLDARAEAPAGLAEHVEACLACRAELARYRRLLRMLAQLRSDQVPLAPGALAELLGSLGGAAERHAIRSALSGHRLAYGAGLGAAVVAATGLVVLNRSSRARTRTGGREPAGI